jgi:Amt family ammonium transporter
MQTNWLWGYLIPIGLLLLTWGGLAPRKARKVTPLAALAVALAVLGYWLVGYALHLGGAGVVNSDPTLANLDKLYGRDAGFGFFGMTGFVLTWDAGEPVSPTALALFLSYLPIITSAVLLVVLALADQRRWLMMLAGTLTGTLIVPVAACWTWGGGWLSQLGATLDLGHGFVDFGGSSVLLWLPGAFAGGVLLLAPRRRVTEDHPGPPPAYFPLLANLGALLLSVGWAGWTLSAPFHTFGATLDWHRAAISAVLGMTGSVLTSQLYAWLVTGEIEPLIAARGVAAGWGAALAGAAFLPPWGALVVGLIAGLAFPLLLYLVDVVLKLADNAAVVALGLTGGLWGLLSVGLLADGRWGSGWNGVGADVGQGVAGLIIGDSSQISAQLLGIAALGLWGLVWGALLGGLTRLGGVRRRLSALTAPEEAAESEESEPAADEDEDEKGDGEAEPSATDEEAAPQEPAEPNEDVSTPEIVEPGIAPPPLSGEQQDVNAV